VSKDEGIITRRDLLQINVSLLVGMFVFFGLFQAYHDIRKIVIFETLQLAIIDPFSPISLALFAFILSFIFIFTSILFIFSRNINIVYSIRFTKGGIWSLIATMVFFIYEWFGALTALIISIFIFIITRPIIKFLKQKGDKQ
jgi:hypothetical protein